ncbi:UvrD-helicase domain-containing protein [Yinghuangia sp. YIM S10712]|uniref:UvrD-helicase domain-containing protein n=1 Tax=Yinghuangia sp. YIM S10712 TaxID=3436930 RepID=UPI003F53A7F4
MELTPAQRLAVSQPWGARTLITAGAGAGKTTTLIHRLEYLTGTEELKAAEILVLTFSRAATRELRERIDRDAESARRVRAQTFDSWALSVLRLENPQRDALAGTSYADRITMATNAIAADVLEASEFGVPAHVIIDEVQDLVGVRREMVETLLDQHRDNCGFTIVGDAAQSIYGFQVEDPSERAGEVNRFICWVRNSFGDELTEVTLSDNFRTRTPLSRIALPFGAALQNLPGDSGEAAKQAQAIHTELCATLAGTEYFGSLTDDFTLASLREFDGTSAILCRDNGQVLYLSQCLHAQGVEHRMQQSPTARPAPSWIADLLLSTSAAGLTHERFDSLGVVPGNFDSNRVWTALRRCAAGPRGSLDLEALHRALTNHALPDELTAAPAHRLLISTVHRAKGLEFDRVLIVEPQALSDRPDVDVPDEARLLYVAMTRARDDIYKFARPETWNLRKHKQTDRWYTKGAQNWARNGIELDDRDVCHEIPPGSGESVAAHEGTQQYLRINVHIGDAVELHRLHDLPATDTETPPYGIFHAGRSIGVASEQFRRSLWHVLKLNRTYNVQRWPCRITDVRIDTLETVAGPRNLTERLGLGDRGVWLAPRLSGLGRFDWTHATSLPEGHRHP